MLLRVIIIFGEVFWLIINNMNNLIIREARLLLQQSIQTVSQLTWKLCIGAKIYKFANLKWDPFCKRWETKQDQLMKISWSQEDSIELQIYYKNNGDPKVLGEGIIDMVIFPAHFKQEIKIALTYEGIVTGWLYCRISLQGQGDKQIDNKFLCIYKISFFFLEDENQRFQVEIFQNTLPIFQKQFTLLQKGKTIFPNLKKPIFYSDVISLSILHKKKQLKTISFLVDNIKRGKTTYFQAWIRNKYNKKIGDLKLEYFLQNLFLQNDREIICRKGLFNVTRYNESKVLKASDIQNKEELQTREQSKQGTIRLKKYQKSQQQNQLLIHSRKNEQKKKKALKIQPQARHQRRPHFSRLAQQFKLNQRAIPCLRQAKTTIILGKPKLLANNEKRQFYFQNPLQN